MKPFLLPGALMAWAALSAWVASQAGALFDPAPRRVLKALVFVALLPLPVLDEVVAQSQFNDLCRHMAAVTLHEHASRGLRVTLSGLPPEPVPAMMVPVTRRKWLYSDAATGQPVMSFNTLEAGAGKLVAALGMAPRRGPLVFSGACDAPGRQRAFDALDLRLSLTSTSTAAPALPSP